MSDDNASHLVSVEQVHEILKEHFPEYISGYCLCGSPIGTYMMWIDHIEHLLIPSASPEDNETPDGR